MKMGIKTLKITSYKQKTMKWVCLYTQQLNTTTIRRT